MQLKLSLLLSVTASAAASWLFIILYDAGTIGPDILANPMENMLHWQFSSVGASAIFRLLLPLLTVFLLLVSWIAADSSVIRRPLFAAGIFYGLFFLVSLYMALEVNFDLYHGDITGKEALFRAVAEQWVIFQYIRTGLLACVLVLSLKATLRWRAQKQLSNRN